MICLKSNKILGILTNIIQANLPKGAIVPWMCVPENGFYLMSPKAYEVIKLILGAYQIYYDK